MIDYAKRERLRVQSVAELKTTEQDYVKDLEILINTFLLPLRSLHSSFKIPPQDIDQLFSCVEILITVNQEVLQNFEKGETVASVFKRMSPYLKMYSTYCTNQPAALDRLDRLNKYNSDFQKFCAAKLAEPQTRGLQLRDFLIKPVQRLCKYPLLLREVLRHTDPGSPEYKEIEEAKRLLDATVDQVNEHSRLKENQMKVIEVQEKLDGYPTPLVEPQRRLCKEGPLLLRHSVSSKGEPKYVFCFNDLIIISKEKSGRFKYFASLPYPAEARFIRVQDIENSFEIEYQGKRFIFSCTTAALSQDWNSLLTSIQREAQKKKLAEMKRKTQASSSSPSLSSPSH